MPLNQQNLDGLLYADPNTLQEILKRLQISGDISRYKSNGVNTDVGYGRIGYGQPVGNEGYLSGGLSASGYKNKYAKDFGLTGADISYSQGDNTIGVEYNQDPMEKLLKLIYERRF